MWRILNVVSLIGVGEAAAEIEAEAGLRVTAVMAHADLDGRRKRCAAVERHHPRRHLQHLQCPTSSDHSQDNAPIKPEPQRNADNPLDCGLLVVDETSMVDVMLMRALLTAVPDELQSNWVDDANILPLC